MGIALILWRGGGGGNSPDITGGWVGIALILWRGVALILQLEWVGGHSPNIVAGGGGYP